MLEYSVSQTVLWSAAYENSNLTHITYDVHDVGVIKKCMQSESNISIIQGIIPDISEDGSLEYNDNITIKSEYTKEMLKKIDFEWPILTDDYLLKYFNYLEKINFINIRRKKWIVIFQYYYQSH